MYTVGLMESVERPPGRGREVVALIRDRARLLRLLRVVPAPARAAITVAMLVTSILPAATSIAVAWLVGRIVAATRSGAGLAPVTAPLVVVGVLLAFDQVMQSLIVPFRTWLDAQVNGEIRHVVRAAVSVRPGIDHLESQVVRDAAAFPVENEYLFNLGAGAEGQLWLLTRFVGAIAAAVVIAFVSIPAAVAAFAFIAWQRSLLRRHYAGAIAGGMVDTTSDGRASSYWSEILGTPLAAKELRLFGFRELALERFTTHGRRPVDELARVLLGARRLHFAIFGLNALAVVVPFALIAQRAAHHDVRPAALTAALGGVIAVARVLGAMGFEAFSIEAAVPQLAAIDELMRFHDDERAQRPTRSSFELTDGRAPEIVFEHVSFSYPNTDVEVLRDLDLVLRPGESVALVGENGAGKTTILKLLCGFYRPTNGRILIDGRDLALIDPATWRARLAVIFQEFTRFELSAFENVALADLDRHDARELASRAAVAADTERIIGELPHAWDTILSRAFTDGADLSGGEWQRVALARALYAAQVGGRVLVLDEPTASLDVAAEVALFDQLLDHASGCTAVVVSHRFSTVRRAERIIVLADGHVAEDGTHDALLERGGRYARLFSLQARRFRDDVDAVIGEPT